MSFSFSFVANEKRKKRTKRKRKHATASYALTSVKQNGCSKQSLHYYARYRSKTLHARGANVVHLMKFIIVLSMEVAFLRRTTLAQLLPLSGKVGMGIGINLIIHSTTHNQINWNIEFFRINVFYNQLFR